MQPRLAKQRGRAMTLIEVLLVIVCLAIMAVVLLPVLASRYRRSSKINCVSNLKQVALATRIWEEDNNNLYPMQVSVTNGGAMELIATNNIVGFFDVMSNELSTPRILVCPDDPQVIVPTNGFGPGFCKKNISYFVGLDATNENLPNRFMFGDDNFGIGNAPIPPMFTPIPSGVAQISTNAYVLWAPGRHEYRTYGRFFGWPVRYHTTGNIGFADGSVSEEGSTPLQQSLIQTGLATNRLAIP